MERNRIKGCSRDSHGQKKESGRQDCKIPMKGAPGVDIEGDNRQLDLPPGFPEEAKELKDTDSSEEEHRQEGFAGFPGNHHGGTPRT